MAWTNPIAVVAGQVLTAAKWNSDVQGNLLMLGGTNGRAVGALRREWAKGADIASASALALGTDGNMFNITGTTSITSFTGVPQAGGVIFLTFAGILTVTHGSNINMNGGISFITAANSWLMMISDGTNLWEVARSSVTGTMGWIRLQQSILAAPATNVTFSSIPASYSTLVLQWYARGDGAGAATGEKCVAQFNADTGGNYDYETSNGTAVAQTSILLAFMPDTTATRANTFGGGTVYIPQYANTSREKEIHVLGAWQDSNASNGLVIYGGGNWRSSSAISSIKVFPLVSTNFLTNSVFTLYGVI